MENENLFSETFTSQSKTELSSSEKAQNSPTPETKPAMTGKHVFMHHKDLPTKFKIRDRVYKLSRDGCLMHPSGKLLHTAQPLPVHVELASVAASPASKAPHLAPNPPCSIRLDATSNVNTLCEVGLINPHDACASSPDGLFPPPTLVGGTSPGKKAKIKSARSWKTAFFRNSPPFTNSPPEDAPQNTPSPLPENPRPASLSCLTCEAASASPPTCGQLRAGGVYVCFNVGRALLVYDFEGSPADFTSPAFHATVKSSITCHDTNRATLSVLQMEILCGTQNGEVVYCDPISCVVKYFNQENVINPSKVTCIRWLPASENMFLVAHFDGCLYLYDKEREDPLTMLSFSSSPPSSSSFSSSLSSSSLSTAPVPSLLEKSPFPFPSSSTLVSTLVSTSSLTTTTTTTVPVSAPRNITLSSSSHQHKQKLDANLKQTSSQQDSRNPVSLWWKQLAQKPILDIAFSPNGRYFAMVTRDNLLKVFDFAARSLLVSFESYFGAFLCVSWSPDARCLLTGGEDDLVTLWSFVDKKILVRCEGHFSWVSSVAFDDANCDHDNYCFGSVGQDGCLLLWEFSLSSPTRSRSQSQNIPLAPHPALISQSDSSLFVPSQPSHAVAVIEPILSKLLHHEPITSLLFRENLIITACQTGQVKIWNRVSSPSSSSSSSSTSASPSASPKSCMQSCTTNSLPASCHASAVSPTPSSTAVGVMATSLLSLDLLSQPFCEETPSSSSSSFQELFPIQDP